MRPLLSAFATFATIPLLLTGCGGSDDSTTTTAGTTKDGASVTLGDNSTDLAALPFYFEGANTQTPKDVDQLNSDYSGKPAYADFSVTTLNQKPFANYSLILSGSIAQGPGYSFYLLEIVGGKNPTAPNIYAIGVVRDINGAILTFNAAQVKAGLPAVFQTLQNNKIEIWSWETTVAGASNGKTYLDYSVNVPTAAGTDLAPFSGQVNTTKLVVSTSSTDYFLVRDEFSWTPATSVLTRVAGSAATNIALPWRPATTQAIGATPPVNTATREVKFGSALPGAYWKAGIGLVESLAVIRDDKLFVYAAPPATPSVTKADGTTTLPTTAAGPINNNIISTTYVEYNVNTGSSTVSGYYYAPAVVPHAAN